MRISRILQDIACKLLRVLTLIYIDDSIILSNEELNEDSALISLMYSLLGLKPSSQKEEAMEVGDSVPQLLKVLGLMYNRISEVKFKIFAPLDKMEKAKRQIDVLVSNVARDRNWEFSDWEKLVGIMIFVLYLTNCKKVFGQMKLTMQMSQERFFWKVKRSWKLKVRLVKELLVTKSILNEVPSLSISSEELNKPVRGVKTDASLDGVTVGLGGVLDPVLNDSEVDGEVNDCDFDKCMALNPILGTKAKVLKVKAFSLISDKLKNSKEWLKLERVVGEKLNIAHIEAFSVLASLMLYEEELKSSRVVLHIDNIAVIYSLAKGSAVNRLSAMLSSEILERLNALSPCYYISYIKSKANIADIFTRYDLLTAGLEEYNNFECGSLL